MNASGFKINNTECEKILGIKVDCGLKFENYLDGVIKKASTKINTLSRLTRFLNLSTKKMLMNFFFTFLSNSLDVSYSHDKQSDKPLTWKMFTRNI